jgi:hypothetical protein
MVFWHLAHHASYPEYPIPVSTTGRCAGNHLPRYSDQLAEQLLARSPVVTAQEGEQVDQAQQGLMSLLDTSNVERGLETLSLQGHDGLVVAPE